MAFWCTVWQSCASVQERETVRSRHGTQAFLRSGFRAGSNPLILHPGRPRHALDVRISRPLRTYLPLCLSRNFFTSSSPKVCVTVADVVSPKCRKLASKSSGANACKSLVELRCSVSPRHSSTREPAARDFGKSPMTTTIWLTNCLTGCEDWAGTPPPSPPPPYPSPPEPIPPGPIPPDRPGGAEAPGDMAPEEDSVTPYPTYTASLAVLASDSLNPCSSIFPATRRA